LLFEKVWRLILLLAVVVLASFVVWSRKRTRTWARIVWCGLAAIPVLGMLSVLVSTPRERIIGLCRELAVLVDVGDVQSIGAYLADDFTAAGLDREEFLARVEQRITHDHVDHARLRRFDVGFSRNDQALVVFDAVCSIRSADAYRDHVLSRWRLTFKGRNGVWRVSKIEALPAPFSPIRNVKDWLP
jgi:hypothetical protein